MRSILSKIPIYFSICVFFYFVTVFGLLIYFNAPNSFHKEDKKFVIDNGMTFRQVAEKLHQEKVIKNKTIFLYFSQLVKGNDFKVRYGEYFFEKNISYYKMLHKMVNGYIYFRKVTIAEGLSVDTAIKRINIAPGLIGDVPEKIREGSLLPETYFYSFNDTKSSMIKRMQDGMQKKLAGLWDGRDKTTPIKTIEEAIILASIVEKETGAKEERGRVASVFVNRLKKKMKLQSDPTIIYSYAFGDKSLERPIKVSDIQNNSSYNTYNVYGLPPTPICNPGIESIKAVLNPENTDYLYFVASGGGNRHNFSTNIKDHNEFVARYRNLQKMSKNNE
jgi:UPF0755 protein